MRTVITYGTFDLFHKGHSNILKRAKEEGDYLIVGVTGESYDVDRGKLSVHDSLETRIKNVRETGFADKIIVEEYLGQKIQDILKYHVDVFVIGSDWKGKFDHLEKYCEVKYVERTKDISSTKLREELLSIYKFGIVSDDIYDNNAVDEAKHVSNIHVESVFSSDKSTACELRDIHELNYGLDDYPRFLDTVDIVYIKSDIDSREEYTRRALEAGKHVICDTPITLDINTEKELQETAEKKDVVLMHNLPILHLNVFNKLIWMIGENTIGDVVNVRASISRNRINHKRYESLTSFLYDPVCTIMRIMGCNYVDYDTKVVKDPDGKTAYSSILFNYDNSTAIVEIGFEAEIDPELIIYGTQGKIRVPDDWWKVGYFTVKEKEDSSIKHFSSNLEGNGFRYLIQDLCREISNDHEDGKTSWISIEEIEATLEVLKTVDKQ